MNMPKSKKLKTFNDCAKIVEGYVEAARDSIIDASQVIRAKHLGGDPAENSSIVNIDISTDGAWQRHGNAVAMHH